MLVLKYARKKENVQRKKIKELAEFSDFVTFFPENDFSSTDGYLIDLFTDKKYTFESKWYGDINFPRYSNKFKNYQIDYSKLQELETKSIEENSTPLLFVFFSNELVIWNINKCDWKKTKKNMYVNKTGGAYGIEKECSLQAYLELSDAIYRNEKITPFS